MLTSNEESASMDASKGRVPRSLEEQLASVVESESFSYVNDGISVHPSLPIGQEGRSRRRRRRGRSWSRTGQPLTSLIDRRDQIADLDRVVVGFAASPIRHFRRVPLAIRFAEHQRSPFIISLREIALRYEPMPEDERVSSSSYLAFEPAPLSIPRLDVLEAMAGDLHVDTAPRVLHDQFTDLQTIQDGVPSAAQRVANVMRGTWNAFMCVARAWFFPRPRIRSSAAPSPVHHSERITSHPVSAEAVHTRISLLRSAIAFGALVLLATLPANVVNMIRDVTTRKAAIAAMGGDAMASLEGSPSAATLREASDRFREADTILSQTNTIAVGLAQLVPTTRSSYRTARALLEVGSKSADAAGLLAKGLDAAIRAKQQNILERLSVVATYADGALPLLEDASRALENVDTNAVPESDRDRVAMLAGLVDDGRLAVREFVGISEVLSSMLGRDGLRRYLVIFQNPSELRPTGGFMGSYAELDVLHGEIQRLEVPGGGTYDIQGQLTTQLVPPEPLQLIADRWEFQDSNWSPDFPKAARKIASFWNASGGYTVDGVIAINATLVQSLLEITGPIEVPELGKTISAENFMLETQKAVELEYDKAENKPKKILGLLAPRIMERLKGADSETMMRVVGILSTSIVQKDIQISLLDETEDAVVQSYGWSGRMKAVQGDALAIVEANIAGQKTDASVSEEVVHDVTIGEDGSIADQVTMTRSHAAQKGTLFSGVRNVSYVRFYLPRGSTLTEASGFATPAANLFDEPREDAQVDPDLASEASSTRFSADVRVWDEGDRTVVGGWTMVDPGGKTSIHLSYRLPFTAFDLYSRLGSAATGSSDQGSRAAYTLLLTSQSGKADRVIKTVFHTPATWKSRWSRGESEEGMAWNGDRVVSSLYDIDVQQP
ncbi:MAG: DUF4012 domain-containing protein [Candidatus Uhrbacteria bacterium]|nr:DUF4012 domain-containing protein [Candidatus Uhrbacteria bacterium]